MDITPSSLLTEITQARYVNPVNWNSPAPGVLEKEFSKGLKIQIIQHKNKYEWKLVHERGGVISTGDSDTLSIAALEAITYAESKVKSQLLNGLLS